MYTRNRGHLIDIQYDKRVKLFSKREHSAFNSKDFREYLLKNNITSIYLAGFLAEYCIFSTAKDALHNDFEVFLISDCIGTGDDVQHRKEQIFQELKASGASIVESNTLYSFGLAILYVFSTYPDFKIIYDIQLSKNCLNKDSGRRGGQSYF